MSNQRPTIILASLFFMTLLTWNNSCQSQTQLKKVDFFKEQEAGLREALAVAEENRIETGLVEPLYNAFFQLGNNYVKQKKFSEADVLFKRAINLANTEGDKKVTMAIEWLAYSSLQQGRYQEAKQLYERALAARTAEYEASTTQCLRGIAKASQALGNYAEAEKILHNLIKKGEASQEGPTIRTVGQYESDLGTVLSMEGHAKEAEACFKQALASKKDPYSRALEAEIKNEYAAFLKTQGQAAAAAEMEKQAQEAVPH